MKIFNTDKVCISSKYQDLIDNIRADKIEINNKKTELRHHINIDDHGFIIFPDFKFTPSSLDENGLVVGMCAIGENFRRFLNEIPKYLNTNSALATCWIGSLSEFMPLGVRPQDKPSELQPIIHKYGILQSGFGGMNHLCPDMSIGLKLGWTGILEKIRRCRLEVNPIDPSFYDGEENLVLGIIEWVEAHAVQAEKMAELESNAFKKDNLLKIANINHKLTKEAPQTFWEACQFLAHFQSVDRMYFCGGALGQYDELLKYYFEKDIEDGILSEEEAVWICASLYFNDTHYGQIAGLTPDGSRDVTSRVSFILLDAMHALRIPTNLGIRVSPKCNNELLKRCVEYTLSDGQGVCYSLEKGISEGFAKNGYPVELGRMRVKSGCNWAAVPGREYPLQDVTRLNMAMALHHALNDLKEEESENRSIEKLWSFFEKHLDIMVDCIKKSYDKHYEVVANNQPEIVLNLFMHGTIERGLNCSNGGVDIMNLNIDGISLATVTDSFAALEQRIEKEQKITWDKMFSILENNWENAAIEQAMMKSIKKFGSPNSIANDWAIRIRDLFVHLCKKSLTPKHNLMIIPGLFSHGDVYMYGDQTPATPNGRFCGDPISHSSEPDPGFAQGLDTFSPALKANTVALAQAGYGNSAPLHLDIDTGLINSNKGIDALVSLINAHEQMGGTLINLNCVSRKTLIEAHEDPTSHPDLVVRVTGYSAFFASLSKEYRQQIVDRFLT